MANLKAIKLYRNVNSHKSSMKASTLEKMLSLQRAFTFLLYSAYCFIQINPDTTTLISSNFYNYGNQEVYPRHQCHST